MDGRNVCNLCNRLTTGGHRFCARCNSFSKRVRLNLDAIFPVDAPPAPRKPLAIQNLLTVYCGVCRKLWKADTTKDVRCQCGLLIAIGRRRG